MLLLIDTHTDMLACAAVVIFLKKIGMAMQVQILGKAVCISHSAFTVGRGMNITILSPTVGE